MPLDIFGFSIGKKDSSKPIEPKQSEKEQSFVTPENYDGSYTLETGGVFGTLIDFAGSVKDENGLIRQFRQTSMFPEVDQAIEDIINESVVMGEDRKPVKLNLEGIDVSDNINYKSRQNFTYRHFTERLNIYKGENFNYKISRINLWDIKW